MKWEAEEKQGGSGGRKKHGCLKVVAILAAVFLVFGVVRCIGGKGTEAQELDWPTTGIATVLPEPSSDRGEIYVDSDDKFDADVAEYEQADYESYVEACRERGFTIDEENSSFSFEAYSSEGYRVVLAYFDSSEEMSVMLYAPVEMGDIAWPTEGPGSLVPVPESLTGVVNGDSSTRFSVEIGNTSPESYASYVDACMAAGFNVDYTRDDDSFSADNAEGAHVSVQYEGFNTMGITVDAPEEVEPTEPAEAPEASQEPEAESTETTAPEGTTTSSSFRQTMDAYEAFINEYVDFMISYQNSDNVVSLLTQYADMMSRYAEMREQVESIDEDSLNADDLAYYLEVMGRVNARLAEIGEQSE